MLKPMRKGEIRMGGIDVPFVNATIAKFAPLSEATVAHWGWNSRSMAA